MDVLVAVQGQYTSSGFIRDGIVWYENMNGLGDFGPLRGITNAVDGPYFVTVADLDQDGDQDVLSSSVGDSTISWDENLDGLGTFGSHQVIATGNSYGGISVTDLDGDGDPDVVPHISYESVVWIRNDSPQGDFNHDRLWDVADINVLSMAIATQSSQSVFDMNRDGVINLADITDADVGWLAVAGAAANNIPLTGGNPFLQGDANVNGVVDGSDFGRWNAAKFTNNTNWSDGNFNADLIVDGSDFGLWNANKFTSADTVLLAKAANPPAPPATASSMGVVPTDTWPLNVRNESGSFLAEVPARSQAMPAIDTGWKARESWWRSRWAPRRGEKNGAVWMDFSDKFQDAVHASMVDWNGW